MFNLKDILSESFLDEEKIDFIKEPFDHVVIDDFFNMETAELLNKNFVDYEFDDWHVYKNGIEEKKTINNWNLFPDIFYKVLSFLNSERFIELLSEKLSLNVGLKADYGLNGGGLHIHGKGGKLNPHLDYNLHPKLGYQRKLNLIVYLSKDWKEEYGGHLGLWTNNTGAPDQLAKEVIPSFNRAVLFDTTQNSWHGISKLVTPPDNIYRRSLAVYYLSEPPKGTEHRVKALFAPVGDQKKDKAILDLIKKRSELENASEVYKK